MWKKQLGRFDTQKFPGTKDSDDVMKLHDGTKLFV